MPRVISKMREFKSKSFCNFYKKNFCIHKTIGVKGPLATASEWTKFLKMNFSSDHLNRIFTSDHILDSCGSEEFFMIKIIEKTFIFAEIWNFQVGDFFPIFSTFSKIRQKSSLGRISSSDGIFGIWDIGVFLKKGVIEKAFNLAEIWFFENYDFFRF